MSPIREQEPTATSHAAVKVVYVGRKARIFRGFGVLTPGDTLTVDQTAAKVLLEMTKGSEPQFRTADEAKKEGTENGS